jgi:hypothetical protein
MVIALVAMTISAVIGVAIAFVAYRLFGAASIVGAVALLFAVACYALWSADREV